MTGWLARHACCRLLPVLLGLVMLTGCGHKATGKTMDDAMALYQDAFYKPANEIAQEHMDEPRGQLIYYLCRVFDSQSLDYEKGLAGLRQLYDDSTLRADQPIVWAEAGLSFGRVVQVNQLRKVVEGRSQIPAKYDGENVRAIFGDIIHQVPETAQGAMAAIYLGESYFRSEDPADKDKGFEVVEEYLAGQKGKGTHIVPVHLYIDIEYVNLRGDYAKSFEHMKEAYELGIVKEVLRRTVLFRLGRTCDIKLNRKADAKEYYGMFLDKYPFAQQTPLVKRYLVEMEGK